VISVQPTTRAKLHKIEREELRFDMTILDRALAAQLKLDIRKMQLETPGVATDLAVVSEIPVDALVIDIRHPDEEERRLLQMPLATVKTIPFYKFNNAFALLPVTTQYFLYCEKGVMSQFHASFLADHGYTNIGVYRPKKNSIPVSG
jgi:tRNA uracil 4-sulfurtransferase